MCKHANALIIILNLKTIENIIFKNRKQNSKHRKDMPGKIIKQ